MTPGIGDKARVMIFALVLAAALAICIAVFPPRSQGNSGYSDSASSPSPAAGAANTPSPAFPTLHFASSGRLPANFHGFHLGDSVEQAIAQDPEMKDCHSEGPPSPSNPTTEMCGDTADGFHLSLSFSRGRLVDVIANVTNIAAHDVSLFDKQILSQLGPPDVEVYRGPSKNNWVWVDGDVRIQYTSTFAPWDWELKGNCNAGMEMAVYPEMIGMIKLGDIVTDQFLADMRSSWGEHPSSPILKPLPDSLAGVQLGMAPWQVRSALPGIEISADSDNDAKGVLGSETPQTIVKFWNGRAMMLFKEWKVSQEDVPKLRNKLLEEFGTPSGHLSTKNFEYIIWEDSRVEMEYMLIESPPNGASVTAWLKDKGLNREKLVAVMISSPTPFSAVPPAHSFF